MTITSDRPQVPDHPGFAAQAELTRRTSAELRQAIGALRSSADTLAALWHGRGASAFLATRLEWERAVSQVQERLAGMEVLLDRARTTRRP